MKSYLSSPLQSKAALEGRLRVLIQPVKPQPPGEGYDLRVIIESTVRKEEGKCRWVKMDGHKHVDAGPRFNCPYPPDSLIYLREKYFAGYPLDEDEHFIDGAPLQYWYYSNWRTGRPFDCSDEMSCHLFGTDKSDWPQWRSPATMPQAAARIYLKSGDPIVKRVQDITEEEAMDAGFGDWEDIWPHDFKVCPKCGGTLTHAALGEGYGVTEVDCDTCNTAAKRFAVDLNRRYPGIILRNDWIWLTPVSVVSVTGKPTDL